MTKEQELLFMKDYKRWQNMSETQKNIKELQKKMIQEKENTSRENCRAAQEELERCFENCFNTNGYEKSINYLKTSRAFVDIISHIPESPCEFKFIKDNYYKILDTVAKPFKYDFEAQQNDITLRLRKALVLSDTVGTAKKLGYDPRKKYTLEEVKELTQTANKYIKEIQEQQKKAEISVIENIVINLVTFIAYTFMIGIIPFLFFYGYFTIAK